MTRWVSSVALSSKTVPRSHRPAHITTRKIMRSSVEWVVSRLTQIEWPCPSLSSKAKRINYPRWGVAQVNSSKLFQKHANRVVRRAPRNSTSATIAPLIKWIEKDQWLHKWTYQMKLTISIKFRKFKKNRLKASRPKLELSNRIGWVHHWKLSRKKVQLKAAL